jgi:plastocyanin
MRRGIRVGVGFALTVACLFLGVVTAGAQSTLKVQAGTATPDQAVQVIQFYPATLTVDVGDIVTWTEGAGERHTVSFGTPPFLLNDPRVTAPAGGKSYDGTGFVSSGLIPPGPGPGYALTFTSTGTFDYQCLIHPGMVGTIVVQPAGAPYPASDTTYTPSSDPRVAVAIQAGTAALRSQTVTTKLNADGTMTYTLNAGLGDGKTFVLMRFGADSLTIHVGDTVTWVNNDPDEVHTVSFLNPGQNVSYILPNGQINPQATAPAGGSVYNGTGFFNSGILNPARAPLPDQRAYSLTFAQAGIFAYECLLHTNLGMTGTIQVLAREEGTLPRSGDVGLGTVGLLGLGLVGIGMALRRLPGS